MTIDWERFAERVPAGSYMRAIFLIHYDTHAHGWLFENKEGLVISPLIYDEPSRRMGLIRIQFFNYPTEITARIETANFEYLVDDRWQTFDEVMQ